MKTPVMPHKRRWNATFARALFLAPGWCAAQDRMADALRKGIVEEETNRDLSTAIQQYQAVLAQYDDDRKSAATALFRIAECYRKQGKSKEAIVAYSRVVRDFGDQTKLADESRNLLSNTYRLPQQQSSGLVDPATAEARRRYRALLEEEIQAFKKHLDLMQRQYEAGGASTLDLNRVQADFAKLKIRLAAFDAGLVPQAPAGVRTQAALAARARYRALLQAGVDYAAKDVDAAKAKYNLGTEGPQGVIDAQIKQIEANLKLAALDAGLAQPSNQAAARQAQ